MNAFAIARYGTPPELLDLPEPADGPDVVARVRFAGLNPVDWKSIDRLTESDRFPYVLGQDFSGDATYVEGDAAVVAGDRVFGIARTYGAYAQSTRVETLNAGDAVVRIPDGVSYEQAAALPTAGLTALAALDVLRVERGTTLAIFGAAGGVGGYATQIAASRGAHVIGIVRGAGDEARALGAQETIDAKAGEPIDALRAAHPAGIDALLDLVNPPERVAGGTRAIAHGGRIVSTIRALDEKALRKAGFEARNVNLVEMPHASADGLTRLAEMVARGIVRVRIADVQPLAKAANVLGRAKAGQIGGGHVLLRVA